MSHGRRVRRSDHELSARRFAEQLEEVVGQRAGTLHDVKGKRGQQVGQGHAWLPRRPRTIRLLLSADELPALQPIKITAAKY